MSDQEITFADADSSEDSHMEECDLGASLTEQASSERETHTTHMRTLLMSSKCRFFLMIRRTVETIEVGKPDWNLLFRYILTRMSHLQFLSTVYVLVDRLISPTWIILSYSISLQWQPGSSAVLACRRWWRAL